MSQARLKEIGIDYPQPNETIKEGSYSFRITAPENAREVRLTIDDGPWLPCRKGEAHWWFDLDAKLQGEHVAVGKVIEADGTLLVTQPRLFQVQAKPASLIP